MTREVTAPDWFDDRLRVAVNPFSPRIVGLQLMRSTFSFLAEDEPEEEDFDFSIASHPPTDDGVVLLVADLFGVSNQQLVGVGVECAVACTRAGEIDRDILTALSYWAAHLCYDFAASCLKTIIAPNSRFDGWAPPMYPEEIFTEIHQQH